MVFYELLRSLIDIIIIVSVTLLHIPFDEISSFQAKRYVLQIAPPLHHLLSIQAQQLTIRQEHFVAQKMKICTTQMELKQPMHKQLVLQQLNGVEKRAWRVLEVVDN